MIKRFAMAAMLLCYAGPAFGQDSERVLQSFRDCHKLADAERLACYDSASRALEEAVASKKVTIVDRKDVRKAKRSLFGFAIPRIDLFGDGRDDEPFTEINTTVASAHGIENNRAEIRLSDEGEPVWRTTDPMPFPPRAGDKIRIRQGALGTYFLTVGGRSYRGMRVR